MYVCIDSGSWCCWLLYSEVFDKWCMNYSPLPVQFYYQWQQHWFLRPCEKEKKNKAI